jgi:methionyl aminopeptidase
MHKDHGRAVEISMLILEKALAATEIGVSGSEIDELVGEECKRYSVKPAFLGVGSKQNPFSGNLCISVNEEVLHSLPKPKKFAAGDLVKLDFGIIYKGFYTDHCITVGLESVSDEDRRLMNIGKLAVESAVAKVAAGVRTGDLGYTMESITKLAGFNVLKNYVGHAIGTSLWMSPEIPAYGEQGEGEVLKEGAVLCIEAQVVAGEARTQILDDGWTIVTTDGSKGVMFEYMVGVQKNGGRILTDTKNWQIFK